MKIEPCPFCGVNLVRLHYHKADGGPEWVECANCHAKGDKRALKQDAIDSWNRLSRIVRAAERLVKARKALVDAFALMDMDFSHFSVSAKARDMDFEIEQANKALTDAVEGGAE